MDAPSVVFRQLAPWRQALVLTLDSIALDALLSYQRAVYEQTRTWPTGTQALAAMRASIPDAAQAVSPHHPV